MGNVVGAGRITDSFGVAKLTGAEGQELWSKRIGSGEANAVAIDGADHVIAAGYLRPSMERRDFTVVKLSQTTGDELWRVQMDRTAFDELGWTTDRANAVAVDPFGDVIAVGSLKNGVGVAPDFAVVKLSGADGTVLWDTEIDGGAGWDMANAVAIDSAGDVVAAGRLVVSDPTQDKRLAVIKLSGSDGTEVWRTLLEGPRWDGGEASSVALDATGDVIAVGHIFNEDTETDFAAVKLSGANGMVLWRTSFHGGGIYGGRMADEALAVALDDTGDAIATGITHPSSQVTGSYMTLVKFSGIDGTVLWRENVGDDVFPHVGRAVVADTEGNAIVAGKLEREQALVKRSTLFTPLDGRRLFVRDKNPDPTKRRLVLSCQASCMLPPTKGSTTDPTISGAVLRLINSTTGQEDSLALPASSWKALGNPLGSRGYSYNDRTLSNGPCKCVVVKAGRVPMWRAFCTGDQIGFSLTGQPQASITVALQMGNGSALCTTFGGTVLKDVAVESGRFGVFKAKNAPPPSSCPLP
jgi:hypothetical protein